MALEILNLRDALAGHRVDFKQPPVPPASAPLARGTYQKALGPPAALLAEPLVVALAPARERQKRGIGLASRNWSGVVLYRDDWSRSPPAGRPPAGAPAPVVLAQGWWTHPAVPVAGPPNEEDKVCIFVGLDGYLGATQYMPQIGTAFKRRGLDPANPAPQHYAWFQWWNRGFPATKQYAIPPQLLRVAPGDVIYAQVWATTLQTDVPGVYFFIKNMTASWEYKIGLPLNVDLPLFGLVPRVEGYTAEWIVERPADPCLALPCRRSPKFALLSDYGTVPFTDWNAAGLVGGALTDSNRHRRRLLQMTNTGDRLSDGARGASMSVPTQDLANLTDLDLDFVA